MLCGPDEPSGVLENCPVQIHVLVLVGSQPHVPPSLHYSEPGHRPFDRRPFGLRGPPSGERHATSLEHAAVTLWVWQVLRRRRDAEASNWQLNLEVWLFAPTRRGSASVVAPFQHGHFSCLSFYICIHERPVSQWLVEDMYLLLRS